jgi:sn-glycerol 3-phosphate transport system substrate-binding protein
MSVSFSKFAAVTCSLLALSAGTASAQERTKVEWWYAIGGKLSETVQELISDFNASQYKYEVVGIHKGNYEETMAAMVSAYRVGQHPTILQSAERGFLTMLNSGAVIPINQLMADNGYETDWGDFIAPVSGFYVVNGEPAALPFNSSTPIFWYNADQFKQAGFEGPAETWQEIDKQLYALKEKGITDCPMALAGDYHWSLIENYSAINNQSFGTKSNGFEGLDTEFVYNTTSVVGQVERLKRWVDDGILHLAGEGLNPTQMFTSGSCATIISSTAGHSTVEAGAEFEWNAAFLPHEEGVEPMNSTIGGAALWVLQNKSAEERAGAAAFIDFVSRPETQVWWSKQTGYVPVTTAAYEAMKAEGYFRQHPTREIAIQQLSRGTPNENSRGFRFGNHNQTGAIMLEELQAVWTGQKTPQVALDSSVSRGNQVLRQYEKINAGK